MDNIDKLVTLIPLNELEFEAIAQIRKALSQPFLEKLAIMPDCHTGYDLPIGGVALLNGVISPAYVGYDIGCGMASTILTKRAEEFSKNDLINLYEEIKKTIPNGEGRERDEVPYEDFTNSMNDTNLYQRVQSKIHRQLGTLGGGNHFIEVGENKYGEVCVTIHSGSRNPGHTICGYYSKLAKKENTGLPDGFFKLDSELGQAYLTDMNFMLEFALENRKYMLREILRIFGYDDTFIGPTEVSEFDFIMGNMINENHNHAEINSDGTVLHRKGATPADLDQYGIIPGNMRDGVFITKGLGNEEYLSSASHGAGRVMSRSKARKTISHDKFVKQMKDVVSSTDIGLLDEAPDAYKDVEYVIKLQEGVVINVVNYIKPLINVKGEGRKRKNKI